MPQEQQNDNGRKVRPVAIENIKSLLAKFALRPFQINQTNLGIKKMFVSLYCYNFVGITQQQKRSTRVISDSIRSMTKHDGFEYFFEK